jgi:predicted Fe-Mo cluster-binding NifX family protein
MKIAISATTPELDSQVDPRFGRAAYFIVADTDTLAWQAYPNPAVSASGGAGTQAAQFIAYHFVQAAVSGDFGPNAYNALRAAAISMYLPGTSQTVKEAIEHFRADQLQQVREPTLGRASMAG